MTLKVNNLQRELQILEEKEARLQKELESIVGQKKIIQKEITDIMKDDNVTNDILGRIYEQRRNDQGKNNKPGRK